MSLQVTSQNFDTEVLQSRIPVLVDFWAPWCGPCRAMLPIIDELSTEYVGRVKVVKVNVDEAGDIAGKYNVMSIPMFLLFKGGTIADSFVGSKPKEDVAAKLDALL